MRESDAFRWLACLGLAACTVLRGSVLEARAEAGIGYTKAQAFSAALRYLRVDLGYEVTEKDAEAAYVLFRFVPDGQHDRATGSIEVVEAGDEVKLLVQIAQMPGYYETILCDGLLRKLQQEYGEPPARSKGNPGKQKQPDKDHGEDQEKPPDGGQDKSSKDPEPD
jgi:hypothetical protein